jgi:hypothetical protein
VFLRYLSVAFEAKFTELTNTPHAARMTPRSTFRKASTERGVERW